MFSLLCILVDRPMGGEGGLNFQPPSLRTPLVGTSRERVVPLFLFANFGKWGLIYSLLANTKIQKDEIWIQHKN